MAQDSFTRHELESLAHSASLFEELLNNGAISKAEHQALLDTRWEDTAHDRSAANSRQEHAGKILSELSGIATSKPAGTLYEP